MVEEYASFCLLKHVENTVMFKWHVHRKLLKSLSTAFFHYLFWFPMRSLLASNEPYQSSITKRAGGIKGYTEWTLGGGPCHYFPRKALLPPKSLRRNTNILSIINNGNTLILKRATNHLHTVIPWLHVGEMSLNFDWINLKVWQKKPPTNCFVKKSCLS